MGEVSKLFVTTYAPLATTPRGREASERLNLPPFIDGSIRREPDLEHRFPSISCLCRGDKFAPRLREGDVVVYITKKGRYETDAPHRRMVAVLEVIHLFDSHFQAAAWYHVQGLPLPSNCMVEGNLPRPIRETHRQNGHMQQDEARWQRRWDLGYVHRARQNGRFVVCNTLWNDLTWTAPTVRDGDFEGVFGRVPGTRNPGALPIDALPTLMGRLGIDFTPRSLRG